MVAAAPRLRSPTPGPVWSSEIGSGRKGMCPAQGALLITVTKCGPRERITAAADGFLEVKHSTYTGERTMVHLGLPGDHSAQWSASLASAEADAMRPGLRIDASVTAEPALRQGRNDTEGLRA